MCIARMQIWTSECFLHLHLLLQMHAHVCNHSATIYWAPLRVLVSVTAFFQLCEKHSAPLCFRMKKRPSYSQQWAQIQRRGLTMKSELLELSKQAEEGSPITSRHSHCWSPKIKSCHHHSTQDLALWWREQSKHCHGLLLRKESRPSKWTTPGLLLSKRSSKLLSLSIDDNCLLVPVAHTLTPALWISQLWLCNGTSWWNFYKMLTLKLCLTTLLPAVLDWNAFKENL